MSKHKVNQLHHDQATRGARWADKVTGVMGSWRFIVIQTVVVLCWVSFNAIEVIFKPFDPYPFILLNLAFSTQAAYAAPLILMSGNRQSLKDRLTLEHTAEEAEKGEKTTAAIMEELLKNTGHTVEILEHLRLK